MRASIVIACTLMLAPTLAFGQSRVRTDAVGPRAAAFYDGGDRLATKKAAIDRIMGVYQTHPPRRHPAERVHIKGNAVQIDVWHPVGRSTDTELKTRAVEWFVFGRTGYADGVRGIFSEFPEVKDVRMSFMEVVRPDETGRRRSKQKDKVKRYLLLRLDRKRFERIDTEKLEGCIERGDCSRAFRSYFKAAKFNRKYTAKARDAE